MSLLIRPLLLFQLLVTSFLINAQEKSTRPTNILVLEIRDEIDARMSHYVQKGLETITKDSIELVILDMDTYGGAVQDADDIRMALLDLDNKTPVYAFINKNAASAGALISIACDAIFMTPGANIGAATVVNGEDGSKAPDKYQSYFRSIMRSTAETKGRNPKIAEAMVDQDLEIEGITEKGKVITFTSSEASKHGFNDKEVSSLEDILTYKGISNPNIKQFQLSNTHSIINFFLNPFVSGILMLIILGGIYFELQTPGVGFPLAAGIIAALLYFIPHYMEGLAQNWEILFFIIGILLLGAEIFVIPGFGIAGISGIICVIAAFTLSMLKNDFLDFEGVNTNEVIIALISTLTSTFIALFGIIFGISQLTNNNYFGKVSLSSTLDAGDGVIEVTLNKKSLIGSTAIAVTVLRPSGKIEIDNEIYDAVSSGEFIGQNDKVKIIGLSGATLRVKKQ